jgi:hypothetical protein
VSPNKDRLSFWASLSVLETEVIRTIMTIVLVCTASLASADEVGVHFDPEVPFQTRDNMVVCPNYPALKEARAAIQAKDAAWFNRIGCGVARGGLKVILIDAPWRHLDNDVTWRGRIYLPRPGGEPEGVDAYFSEDDVMTYALGYKRFRNAVEAEQEFRRRTTNSAHIDFPKVAVQRTTISDGSGVKLLFGPSSYKLLYLYCAALMMPDLLGSRTMGPVCDPIGRLPK